MKNLQEYHDYIHSKNLFLAMECQTTFQIIQNDAKASAEFLRGGGNNGGILAKGIMRRPMKHLRISQDALQLCMEKDIVPYKYFVLNSNQLRKEFKNFFQSNKKTVEECHAIGHYLTGDHNMPNKAMIEKMHHLTDKKSDVSLNDYLNILDEQSLDLITVEENECLNRSGFRSGGDKALRDALCSPKIELVDLCLAPVNVIDSFFEITGLDKKTCLDPCALDGRWLHEDGYSMDIAPMAKNVHCHDFLTFSKKDMPDYIQTIVGYPPDCLLKEFVEKAFELTPDCYFMVNDLNILEMFSDYVEHLYIFSDSVIKKQNGLNHCSFTIPYLHEITMPCYIVHLNNFKQDSTHIKNILLP